jgi:hypothetical protein
LVLFAGALVLLLRFLFARFYSPSPLYSQSRTAGMSFAAPSEYATSQLPPASAAQKFRSLATYRPQIGFFYETWMQLNHAASGGS